MKNSGIMFGIVITAIFFITCGQSQKNENNSPNVTKLFDGDTRRSNSSNAYSKHAIKLDSEVRAIKDVDPFGTFFFSDGSLPGANISVSFGAGDKLNFYVIGVDSKGQKYASKPFELLADADEKKDGVQIVLTQVYDQNGVKQKAFSVSKVDKGLAKGNKRKVGNNFDAKIVKGGSNTNGLPGIVGADDARSGKGGAGILSILDWDRRRVVLHRVDDGGPNLQITHESVAPVAKSDWCYWSFGQSCWGWKFEKCYNGC